MNPLPWKDWCGSNATRRTYSGPGQDQLNHQAELDAARRSNIGVSVPGASQIWHYLGISSIDRSSTERLADAKIPKPRDLTAWPLGPASPTLAVQSNVSPCRNATSPPRSNHATKPSHAAAMALTGGARIAQVSYESPSREKRTGSDKKASRSPTRADRALLGRGNSVKLAYTIGTDAVRVGSRVKLAADAAAASGEENASATPPVGSESEPAFLDSLLLRSLVRRVRTALCPNTHTFCPSCTGLSHRSSLTTRLSSPTFHHPLLTAHLVPLSTRRWSCSTSPPTRPPSS